MDRRNFLSLLIVTPLVPALAKLRGATDEDVREALAPEPEPELELDEGFGAPRDDERATTLNELFARVERQHVPRRVQRMILPFSGETTGLPMVEPGRIERYVSMPQRPFRGERLIAEPGFELLGLSVGGAPQFDVDPESVVPTEIFGFEAYGPIIRFERADPGQVLVMVVRNVSGHAQRFNAALVGDVPAAAASS